MTNLKELDDFSEDIDYFTNSKGRLEVYNSELGRILSGKNIDFIPIYKEISNIFQQENYRISKINEQERHLSYNGYLTHFPKTKKDNP